MLPIRYPFQQQLWLKVKGWGKTAMQSLKECRVAILLFDKVYQQNLLYEIKKRHCVMIKVLLFQKGITFMNMYLSKSRAPNCMKQTVLMTQTIQNITCVSLLLSTVNRSFEQYRQIGLYPKLHQAAAEHKTQCKYSFLCNRLCVRL